jgi:hypothetical protein
MVSLREITPENLWDEELIFGLWSIQREAFELYNLMKEVRIGRFRLRQNKYFNTEIGRRY